MKADPPALTIIPDRVPWTQVGLFAALTLLAAWLVGLPYHLGWLEFGGPYLVFVLIGLMFTPTLATVVLVLTLDRGRRWHRRLGLGVPAVGRFFAFLAVAWLLPVALAFTAPFVGALLGWYELDLEELSGFQEVIQTAMAQTGGDADELFAAVGVRGLMWIMVAQVLVGGLVNTAAAFGEELGWRGWLLPKLLPLGAWPAMLLSGALWGVWHAPLILLGYNYPSAPVWGVLLFTLFCMLWGVLHGWMRIATGSVWPAALMHGSLNASAGTVILFHAAGYQIDNVWVGTVGLSGWIAPLLVVALLAAVGWLPGRVWPDRDVMPAGPEG